MPLPITRGTAVLCAATLLGGGATGVAAQSAPTGRTPVAAADREPAAVARARADSVRHPYTVADVRFMSAMIGHHAQAVAMSRLAPTRAASASVRTLAERIINAQQDEIAIMQQWLRERRQPVPDPRAADHAAHDAPGGQRDAHAGPGGHDGHASATPGTGVPGLSMPGMLTAAQLGELEAARGAEFDQRFLAFMIQHHRGAVAMVTALFGSHGAGQDETVFKFASDVNVDQTTEIARMQRMLADLLFGAP